MEIHPKINWIEVIRQAIRENIEPFDVMDELRSSSELSESDVADIAHNINARTRKRVEEEWE